MKRTKLFARLLIAAFLLFFAGQPLVAQFQTQPSLFKDIEPDSLKERIEKLPSIFDVKRLETSYC